MMNRALRVAALSSLLVLSGHCSASSDLPCLQEGYFSDRDVVSEIPISVAFKNSQLNAPWFLGALTSALTFSDEGGRRHAAEIGSADVNNGQLLITFCISDHRIKPRDELAFHLGPRKLTLLARDSTARRISRLEIEKAGASISSDLQSVTYLTSPLIAVLPQSDPDWIVVTKDRAERTKEGALRLELQIFNPVGAEQQGVEVQINFVAMPTLSCLMETPRPPSKEIRVAIELLRGSARAYATEPTLGKEDIERSASLLPEACHKNAMLTLDLGSTGTLSRGFNTIRYAFEKNRLLLPKDARIFLEKRYDDIWRDVMRWPFIEAKLVGTVFPKRVEFSLSE